MMIFVSAVLIFAIVTIVVGWVRHQRDVRHRKAAIKDALVLANYSHLSTHPRTLTSLGHPATRRSVTDPSPTFLNQPTIVPDYDPVIIVEQTTETPVFSGFGGGDSGGGGASDSFSNDTSSCDSGSSDSGSCSSDS